MKVEEQAVQEREEQTGLSSATHDQEEDDDHEGEAAALPEIPSANLTFDFSSFMGSKSEGPKSEEEEKVNKRASNVMKLAQENEKLKAELKAMTDRLEAAERRRKELTSKSQRIMEE